MTTEEKLEHFTTVTVEDVHKKCEASFNEYKKNLDEKLNQHKLEAERISKLKEKTMRDGIERKMSKEYTMEQLHLKRKINHKQDELRNLVFDEVKTRLAQYKKMPEYKELLIKQIRESAEFAKECSICIYIDGEDAYMKEELERETGVELHVSDRPLLGGTRGEIQEKNILIDKTFFTRIEEEKEKFYIMV